MEDIIELTKSLPHLGSDLLDEINEHSSVQVIPENTEILREGQYVKVIPIVLSGLIKVFTRYEDKELLLYYIQPNQSCVMSFSSNIQNEPSKVFAVTEVESRVLLMPVDKVSNWIRQYPNMNVLFFRQFNERYKELLDTINHLIYDKLDVRLWDYLVEKTTLTGHNPLNISHRQIATELGTAREVISRILKKFEREGKIAQLPTGIKIL